MPAQKPERTAWWRRSRIARPPRPQPASRGHRAAQNSCLEARKYRRRVSLSGSCAASLLRWREQLPEVITAHESAANAGDQKYKQQKIPAVGVDERLPWRTARFTGVFLDNRFVDPVPTALGVPQSPICPYGQKCD